MLKNEPKIVIYGAGAVGTSVYAWISANYNNIYLLARGKSFKTMKSRKKIRLYSKTDETEAYQVPVNVIEDLNEVKDVDVIIIAVKNYHLDSVAQDIHVKIGSDPLIVGLQNGVENQKILPKYFKNVIYAVVSYNVWKDEPDIVGYSSKGPIILGTLIGSSVDRPTLEKITSIFNLGFETLISPKIQDAIHNKLVINLANSFNTIIGHNYREIKATSLQKKILFNLFSEGLNVIEMAGYEEESMRWMPSWERIRSLAKNPEVYPNDAFKAGQEKLGYNSMAQDIYLAHRNQTEIEYLNGYFIVKASELGISIPYIKTLYDLAKKNFGPNFEPMTVDDLWEEIQKHMND